MTFSLAQAYAWSFLALLVVAAIIHVFRVKWVNTLFAKCWIGDDMQLRHLRGKNYYLTMDGQAQKYCFVTSWAVTHVALYALLGFYFPDKFFETFAIGVGFEALEWITFDCHDWVDVFWNTLGFVIGFLLRKVVTK